jgi:hypothetical protein
MERLGSHAEENKASAMEVNNKREFLMVWRERVWEKEAEKGFGSGVERDILGESELG